MMIFHSYVKLPEGRSQNQGYPKPMVVSRGRFSIPIVGWWRVCLKIMHTYLIGISSQGPGWAGEAIKKKTMAGKILCPILHRWIMINPRVCQVLLVQTSFVQFGWFFPLKSQSLAKFCRFTMVHSQSYPIPWYFFHDFTKVHLLHRLA